MLLIHAKIAKLCTAKRILERRGIQTSSTFVKIWLVCIPEFKANFLFLRIYWSPLDHDLMASIWGKAISILAGNLNSGLSYLITAVKRFVYRLLHRSLVFTYDYAFFSFWTYFTLHLCTLYYVSIMIYQVGSRKVLTVFTAVSTYLTFG